MLGRLAGRSRHECGGSGATGQRRAALRSGTVAQDGRHGEEEGAAKWVRRVSEHGDTLGRPVGLTGRGRVLAMRAGVGNGPLWESGRARWRKGRDGLLGRGKRRDGPAGLPWAGLWSF